MAAPDPRLHGTAAHSADPRLVRAAIWVAIGALIAAALVCVVWVLVGSSGEIIGRAFGMILLLAAFAGAAILDAHLAPRRAGWFALASMIGWVVILIVGVVMIWLPTTRSGFAFVRFAEFLLIVLIIQLALLHLALYAKAVHRNPTTFVRVLAGITVALIGVLALMLVLSLTLNEFIDFRQWYWRLTAAITVLAAVGTVLVPLTNLLFAPRQPRPDPAAPPLAPTAARSMMPAYPAAGQTLQPWPVFADGRTPLPVLPDGSPDWTAFYTGRMSPGAQPPRMPVAASRPPAGWPPPTSAGSGQGYPPVPPLPPTR